MTRRVRAVARGLGAALALALCVVPGVASACRGPAWESVFIHETLPPDANAPFAAMVEVVSEFSYAPRRPLRARVIKVLKGHYAGQELLIDPQVISSCDRFPARGDRGVVMGDGKLSPGGVLILEPVRLHPRGLSDAPPPR